MRILYFSRDYTTHDWRFLREFAEAGHQVWFIRLEDDGNNYETRELPGGVTGVEWHPGGQCDIEGDELVRKFSRVLNDVKPDVVHAGPVHSCAYIAARSGCHPLATVSWGSDILVDSLKEEYRQRTIVALESADLFFCDCDAVKEQALTMSPLSENQVVSFPWGIEPASFTPGKSNLNLREELGWQDNFVLLSTRSWENIYGIDILIEAVAKAQSTHPQLRLILAGNGSLHAEVEAAIDYHGLRDSVYMPGRIPNAELADYFRLADAYISCTYSDGSSISLLEAMSTGLPAIVTGAYGNVEWVEEGVNGFLAEPGSAESFAESIIKATQCDVALIAAENRKKILARADWKKNFVQLLAAYEKLTKTA